MFASFFVNRELTQRFDVFVTLILGLKLGYFSLGMTEQGKS